MALKELLTNLEEGIQSYPNHNTPSTSGGFNYGQSTTRIFDTKTFRQRDYKFGEGTAFDRPGNEFSREPLIGKNIDLPAPNDSPSGGGFLGFIGSLTDGFVRGGIVNALSRSAKDVARITKFYLTSRGIGFIAKNVALQLTNPRIPVGSTTVFGLELDRNRTFNLGLNLIAQAGVNFSGIHFDRSGATPIFPEADKYEKYYSDFGDGSDIGEIDKNKGIVRGNRLLTLYDSAILGNGEGTPEDEKGKLGQFVEGIGNKVKELTGRGGEELFSYNGGPGSTYGIGKTRILRATNTRTEDLNPDYDFMIIGGLEDALGNATKKLKILSYEEYLEKYIHYEYDADNGSSGLPNFVFRTPSQEYGLVPPPDKAYTVIYEYYRIPVDLENHDDVPAIPERFKHVITDGAMHYAYLFRGNSQDAIIAKEKFEEGIKNMRSLLINRYDYVRSTFIPSSISNGRLDTAFN